MDILKSHTLGEIAQAVAGDLDGDPGIVIRSCSGFDAAEEGSVTFAEDERRLALAEQSQASAIITFEGAIKGGKPLIRVENPRLAFALTLTLFARPHCVAKGVHPTAILGVGTTVGKDVAIGAYVTIGENVTISDRVVIYPHVFVGCDVKLGEGCSIYPNVSIMNSTVLGKRCILYSGAVIGADGFGYVFSSGKHVKIPQIGHVVLGDDVEVGANTTIDRATTGVTKIGNGTKIDNLVQIAHNCNIGQNCIIVSQVGLSGSVTLEDGVILAGQVGVKEHVTIGKGSIVGGQSGVLGDMPSGSTLWGTPARPQRETLEMFAHLVKLPATVKVIKDLKKRLEKLEEK